MVMYEISGTDLKENMVGMDMSRDTMRERIYYGLPKHKYSFMFVNTLLLYIKGRTPTNIQERTKEFPH